MTGLGRNPTLASGSDVHEWFSSAYSPEMPKRYLTDPPPELEWCIRCRKVLGDYGGLVGGQCFCDQPVREDAHRPSRSMG
jgi:hypothetical protein